MSILHKRTHTRRIYVCVCVCMILKPCNRLCVEPPTPRPQCFNARVSKGDFGGLIILSFGAKAPQFTLTLNFGGGWVVLDGKGLNNSSIYGVCVCVCNVLCITTSKFQSIMIMTIMYIVCIYYIYNDCAG